MPVYRILKRVDKGGSVGGLCRFDWLSPEQRQRLMDLGVISRMQAPPLKELPGWKRRAQRFAALGIDTVEQAIEADPAEIARHMRVKASTVEGWQADLAEAMTIPLTKRG